MRDPAIAGTRASGAPHAPAGRHWFVDCHGVASNLLADAATLRTLFRRAAEATGARILFDHFHDFGQDGTPGVTGVVLLAESHATIHTWPDAGYAAIDFFLCGAADARAAVALLEHGLAPGRVDVVEHRRGVTGRPTSSGSPPKR